MTDIVERLPSLVGMGAIILEGKETARIVDEIETLSQRVKELEEANELVKKRMDWEAGRAAKLDVALEDTTARAESFEGSFNACEKELAAERDVSDKLEKVLRRVVEFNVRRTFTGVMVAADEQLPFVAESMKALAELEAMRKGETECEQ